MKILLLAATVIFAMAPGVIRADHSVIYNEACKKWPEDKQMQDHYIKTEKYALKSFNSYSSSRDMPDAALRKIKKWCQEKWPRKYGQQWYMLKKEAAAYQTLGQFKSRNAAKQREINKLKADAAKKWPKSYSMQVYVVENA